MNLRDGVLQVDIRVRNPIVSVVECHRNLQKREMNLLDYGKASDKRSNLREPVKGKDQKETTLEA